MSQEPNQELTTTEELTSETPAEDAAPDAAAVTEPTTEAGEANPPESED